MPSAATATELDDAITRHRTRLLIPGLNQGQMVVGVHNTPAGPVQFPFARSGQFARVYRINDSTGRGHAIRCFYTAPRPDYQQRYSAISAYFRQHLQEMTAGFAFHQQGIRVRPKPNELVMPVMEMEWVEGETIIAYLDRLAKQGDSAGLRRLANAWMDLVSKMKAARMAHGDLSGENIMVRSKDTSLVLIDYDGVYIPAFAGQTTDQAGNPSYQHPDLQNRPYNESMDNFSALCIYVGLQALAHQPSIWMRYSMHDPAGNLQTDNILFKTNDLRNPSNSRLFAELSQIKSADLQKWVRTLSDACRGPVDRVPDMVTGAGLACPSCGASNAKGKVLCGSCGKTLMGSVRNRSVVQPPAPAPINHPRPATPLPSGQALGIAASLPQARPTTQPTRPPLPPATPPARGAHTTYIPAPLPTPPTQPNTPLKRTLKPAPAQKAPARRPVRSVWGWALNMVLFLLLVLVAVLAFMQSQ